MIHHSLRKNAGFTLVELMITAGVLVIIAGIAIPAYTGYILTSKRSECLNELAAIKLAEEEFFLANNTYFAGGDAATLQGNSTGIYQPTPEALGVSRPPNCTYSVVAGAGGLASSYVLTVTGINDLAAEGVIEVYTSQ